MTEAGVSSRATIQALLSPAVIFPAAVGAMIATVAAMTGTLFDPPGFLGLGLVALGGATAAYRLLFQRGQIAGELEHNESEKQRQTTAFELRELRRRLRADGDPRMIGLADSLRKLNERLGSLSPASGGATRDLLPELRSKADALWANCLAALRRAAELSAAADQMSTSEARQRMVAARESLVDEAERSVRHLGATLDHLQAAALGGDRPDESLAHVREELEMGLEVARRVEQRMEELDRQIDPAQRVNRHRLES